MDAITVETTSWTQTPSMHGPWYPGGIKHRYVTTFNRDTCQVVRTKQYTTPSGIKSNVVEVGCFRDSERR